MLTVVLIASIATAVMVGVILIHRAGPAAPPRVAGSEVKDPTLDQWHRFK
jgi:hypothetical protein